MSNRIWIIVTAIICVAILAMGGLLFIKPKIDEIAASAAAVAAAEATNTQYELDLQNLKLQFENIAEVESELDDLREALPSGPDHAGIVRMITSAATRAGVTIDQYASEVPIIYGATDVASGAASAANPGSISGGTLVAIPITIGMSVSSGDPVFAFMEYLRTSTRLVLIYDWTITPDTTDGIAAAYDVSIKAYVYSLVDPNEPVAEPAKQEPTPTPTPTPTAGLPEDENPNPSDTEVPTTP